MVLGGSEGDLDGAKRSHSKFHCNEVKYWITMLVYEQGPPCAPPHHPTTGSVFWRLRPHSDYISPTQV